MDLEAKDLRIGNWVTLVKQNIYENKDYKLNAYDIYKASEFDNITECLLPIPLTEEWFFDFGFEIEEDYFVYVLGYDFGEIKIYRQGGYFFIEDVIKQEVKHVHQLQNLYHSLTGGLELEII